MKKIKNFGIREIKSEELTIAGSVNSLEPGIVFNVADSHEIIRIENDGRIFWKQREVETDNDFRAAMLDLRDTLMLTLLLKGQNDTR